MSADEEVSAPVALGVLNEQLFVLDPATRAVLDAASVIGAEFEFCILQRVTGLADASLHSSLQSAGAVRIIERRRADLRYRFRQPLLQEALYAAIPVLERSRLHARIGLVLEGAADSEGRLEQLAYHFCRAAGAEYDLRAIRYSRLAGDAAMGEARYEDASSHYASALGVQPHLAESDAGTTCELLLASAAALSKAGRRRESQCQWRQAVMLARERRLANVLLRAARQVRPTVMSAFVPNDLVVCALEAALADLPADASGPRALALSRLASLPPYALDLERSRKTSDEAMRLAVESRQAWLIFEALRSRFRALSGPDSTDELLRVTEELLLVNSYPQLWCSADALIMRYQTLLRRGDVVAAEHALATLGQLAKQFDDRTQLWEYERIIALRALQAGRLDEAEQRFKALFAKGRRLELPLSMVSYVAQLEFLRSRRTGRAAWSRSRATPLYRAQQIWSSIQDGDLDAARQGFHALAGHGCVAVTRDSNFLYVVAMLGLASITLDEEPHARTLYGHLEPYAEMFAVNDFTFSLGSVSYHLGLLACYLGWHAKAREHLERAIQRNSETGHELHAQRARLALAELLTNERPAGRHSESSNNRPSSLRSADSRSVCGSAPASSTRAMPATRCSRSVRRRRKSGR